MYWKHSVIMCLTKSSVPQVLHIGFSSFAMSYPTVGRVVAEYNIGIIVRVLDLS